MMPQSLYRSYQRYRTLQTHHISSLPIVILMPHSACNCQCVMCDIWKDNKNLKQLTIGDIKGLISSLKSLHTQQVVMSGGEALLNPNFFQFCEILQSQGLRISLLSTGMTVRRHADRLLQCVDSIIVSLDGDEPLHDSIRNIPGAFSKLKEGVRYLKTMRPDYPITARTVIHKLNFRRWDAIIETAQELGLDQVSFLAADVSSEAFNRKDPWNPDRQNQVLPSEAELLEMQEILNAIKSKHLSLFENRFIAESPGKLQKLHDHYSAMYGHNAFPYKKCNAPWVSAVIEADGSVRPCFFHAAIGNIREESLTGILNGVQGYKFRKELNMDTNQTCMQCVCSLNLPPTARIT